MIRSILLASSLFLGLNGDMYLHMPRGSNNRLNEASANRDNANRLFDSQNNNRGGYNVGDLDTEEGFNGDDYIADASLMYDFEFFYENDDEHEKQYEMLYYEESYVSVTWTNQHGTGNKKLNSHVILQYICDTFERADTSDDNNYGFGPSGDVTTVAANSALSATELLDLKKHGLRVELYNGGNTNTPDSTNNIGDITSTYQSNHNNARGRRESEEYYYLCQNRYRNYGLFHADQDLNGNSQIYTRQNPDGTRRGLECPEERDYYPWWHPSPFHDIAIITPDVSYCESDLAPNSQNVKEKYQCLKDTSSESAGDLDAPTDYLAEDFDEYQYNETTCEAMGGSWEGFRWGTSGDASDQPECVDSYWTKVNYLGNTDNTLRGGMQAKYDWQIPSYDSLVNEHFCWEYEYIIDGDEFVTDPETGAGSITDQSINCVRMMFRIRYNMSTMDYDPYTTTSEQDYDDNAGVLSPIEQNPDVDIGAFAQGLRLAINTAQTGRTFQDNSHTFLVCEKPSSAAWASSDMLLNVNVRGKRGNIVQTFPAIEYDFEPKHIEIEPGQCMHFQWTGSNTHNNGNPGGDGQTGDAGEGRGGSDRSNFVQMYSMQESYPLTYDKFDDDFFDYVTCYHPIFSSQTVSSDDARLILGTAGFYRSTDYAEYHIASTTGNDGQDGLLDVLLNNVSASFRQGLVCCINSNALSDDDEIIFAFLSTRNNNFTNRAQKAKIIITNDPLDSSQW